MGLQLKLLRRSRHLKQKDVCQLIGVHRNTLSNYEHNKTHIPISVFIKLIYLYHI
ncbi:MAG: helix-turn-helix transcriptional regulator [Clostridia bacterium]|nr:helix-turn-helix transcriptional regulator [Clostridia bacterium]